MMKVPLSAGYPGNTPGGSSLRNAGVLDVGSQTRQYPDGNAPSGIDTCPAVERELIWQLFVAALMAPI